MPETVECAKVHAMDTNVLSPERLFTVAEYHRMGEAGVFDDDERVELVDGKVVRMSPIGPRHQLAVEALAELLLDAVDRRHVRVRQQGPVMLNERTERHPDVSLIRYPWGGFPGAHPGVEDILLIAEVSDATVHDDKLRKLPRYARDGVREVWIVDLTINKAHVYRTPDRAKGRYARDFEVGPDGKLEAEALPGVSVPTAPVFYPSRG
jgi:Uma2 family endonuclease